MAANMTYLETGDGSEVRGGRADSYNVVVSDGYSRDPPAKIFLCNVTVHGTVYQLHGDDPKDAAAACWNDRYDHDGAAMYAIVTISVFATAIGFFIGMMSFKKKKYDVWDRQAGAYLGTMYQRRLKEEKLIMSLTANEFPNLGLLKRMSGVDSEKRKLRRCTVPNTNEFDWKPSSVLYTAIKSNNSKAKLPSCTETRHIGHILQQSRRYGSMELGNNEVISPNSASNETGMACQVLFSTTGKLLTSIDEDEYIRQEDTTDIMNGSPVSGKLGTSVSVGERTLSEC